MIDLTMSKLNIVQVVDVGDAVLRRGDAKLAAAIYRVGLANAPEDHRARIVSRIAMAEQPGPRVIPALDTLQALERIAYKELYVGEGLATWLKILPFMEDPRFVELADRHAALLPMSGWHWNLQTVAWAVRQARDLPGDFVELGVFKGHTTLFVSEYLGFAGWPKTWWLYDTFEGIPADQLDAGWAKNNASAYEGSFSLDEVQARFAHIPNIRVVKGRAPEILDAEAPDQIAFLHMDLNNATAEVASLDRLYDRIAPGGIIVFDDFLWGVSRAQYDAETAWFAERGLAVLPLPTGQGLFVKPA